MSFLAAGPGGVQECGVVDSRPIGVFDSGVGGLTVAREILRLLPNESVLYLGDTARVPYGPRGPETIRRFALAMVQFLVRRNVKALVVACNSVSACAIEAIRAASPVPVIEVIRPTVEAALRRTRSLRIGVIGTAATVNSGVYPRHVYAATERARVALQACPLFVPLAEEGLHAHPVTRMVAREYLAPLRAERIDVLVLGCTHYPLLRRDIAAVMGRKVTLVDSAGPTARALRALLEDEKLENRGPVHHRFCVTDASPKFLEIAHRILGVDIRDWMRPVTLDEEMPAQVVRLA
jgi:glutamate racemase